MLDYTNAFTNNRNLYSALQDPYSEALSTKANQETAVLAASGTVKR